VLAPTALTADAGDGRAYLRWNLQLEDERVVGWTVFQTAPREAVLTPTPLTEPQWVVRGLRNGVAHTFAVAGVLRGGRTLTPRSAPVTVIPRATGTATVTRLGRQVPGFGSFTNLVLVQEDAVRIAFPDGQQLVFGDARPVDWVARDGTHLLYPLAFGNGLDIGRFDARGLPLVIPPAGLDRSPLYSSAEAHAPFEPMNPDYRDVQYGTLHPHITDPLTQPFARTSHDARPRWLGASVDGDRVTVHYLLPLTLLGYRSWTAVEVWETWWPLERDRHGTAYQGLARFVEVCMPSAHKDGYQVMLNNGFGPGGTRQGVTSYSTGFREPGGEIVDFSADTNRQVCFQGSIPARQGYGYHPNGNSLQASPLIFYDWGRGSLTITARSLYYHAANNSASYPEQGADGVWPNLAWDLGAAGRRTAVDTVEYLYAGDPRQPLPQRYVNAHLEALNTVSRRMGVQDAIGAVALVSPHGQIVRLGGPETSADHWLREIAGKGVDVVGMYHDTWQALPPAVPLEWLYDASYRDNPALGRMNAKYRAAGVHPGFWFRPEFCMTSVPSALSDTLLPVETFYHSIDWAAYPPPAESLVGTTHSLPLIRRNPHWMRRQRDGAWPVRSAYQWIPMSLASGWWDQLMWPALHMSAKLGFERVLTDGGFGGLQGVDYAPLLDGRADTAVPCQPYWWRYFRTLHHLGIRQFGECTGGWMGANTSVGGPSDEYNVWLFQGGSLVFATTFLKTPEALHRGYQLYNACWSDLPAANAVRRYAVKVFKAHRAPDWIELKDLREGEAVEVTVTKGGSVAGRARPTTPEDPATYTLRPWTWTDAVWHYDDGTEMVYPAYGKIDWSGE
jgi:hypothetical protein